jgi:hypothetical protein
MANQDMYIVTISRARGHAEFVYLPAPESSNYRPLTLLDRRRPMIALPVTTLFMFIPLHPQS